MNTGTTIQYDTAKLREQHHAICESRWNALRSVISDAYIRTTGLSLDAPPELWRFVIGLSEPLSDWEPDKDFRTRLGTPTLRETVQSLTEHMADDAVLAKHLATLLKLFKRGPLTNADYDSNRADVKDRTTRILIHHWIQDPPRENWAIAGLCFCSDLAIAKLVYFMANRTTKWLPPTLLNKEPERIRKVFRGLGLIPARPRIIKDIDFKAGKIHWIPFKKVTYKGD